jgi:DNA repair protein RadC
MENINKPSSSIKNWAIDDRPREKLSTKGPEALSDAELLAILINNGNKQKSAVELARDVMALGNNHLGELGKLSVNALKKIKGIGPAKAITIAAALELGRRRHSLAHIDKKTMRGSSDIGEYLKTALKDYNYEVFAVVFLNYANKIKHFEVVSKGGFTATVADPRLILKKALEHEATSIILCHNHPSGNLKPSSADRSITQKIKQAAKFIDIEILDHIIISDAGFYSFADNGDL